MESIDRAKALITHTDDSGNEIIVNDENKVYLKLDIENRWRWIGTLFKDPRYNGRLTFGKREDKEGLFRKTIAWSVPYIILKVPEINAISIQVEDYEYLILRTKALDVADIMNFKQSGYEKKAYIQLSHFMVNGLTPRTKAMVNLLHHEWLYYLEKEFTKPYMKKLSQQVREERESKNVYPHSDHVFLAYNMTPISKVKVVILSGEPYPSPLADGKALSSSKQGYCPKALENVFIKLRKDYGYKVDTTYYHLNGWTRQGVLLMNAVLTVRENEPGSHFGIGWEKFTEAAVKAIAMQQRPVAWLLWGVKAQEFKKHIRNKDHLILSSSHPADEEQTSFMESNHFRQVNQYLISNKAKEVLWSEIR